MPNNPLETPLQRQKDRFKKLVEAGGKVFDSIPAEGTNHEDHASWAMILHVVLVSGVEYYF